jgi:hypothetical protein
MAIVRTLVEVIALPILRSGSKYVTEIMSRTAHMQLQGIGMCHKASSKRIGYFTRMVQASARRTAHGWIAI